MVEIYTRSIPSNLNTLENNPPSSISIIRKNPNLQTKKIPINKNDYFVEFGCFIKSAKYSMFVLIEYLIRNFLSIEMLRFKEVG